jgi:ubiquinone/menaquinone biosynthesis C-methylase UbiE
MNDNHSVNDYNQMVGKRLNSMDEDAAMAESVGGHFYSFGKVQRNLLLQHGLEDCQTLLDIGCGSGRLAYALKDIEGLQYTGIDVVQDLLNYAQNKCQRDDWQFIKSTDFSLPRENDSTDMITAFSIFTHLLHEESYKYLMEAHRILKPGGKIVFSFLDFSVPSHWPMFISNIARPTVREHLNQFIDIPAITAWCRHLHFKIFGIYPGNEDHIILRESIEMENGSVLQGATTLGQSVCVLEKPLDMRPFQGSVLPDAFDPALYLAANPDVAEAGTDPATHYLRFGIFEGRKLRP